MFRASLTSILSVPHVIRPFNSLEEFISSEYRLYTVAGDSHVERLREKDSGTLNRLWSAKIAADPDSRLLPTVADGVDKVLEEGANAFYHDEAPFESAVGGRAWCDIEKAWVSDVKYHYSMVLRKNSPYTALFAK